MRDEGYDRYGEWNFRKRSFLGAGPSSLLYRTSNRASSLTPSDHDPSSSSLGPRETRAVLHHSSNGEMTTGVLPGRNPSRRVRGVPDASRRAELRSCQSCRGGTAPRLGAEAQHRARFIAVGHNAASNRIPTGCPRGRPRGVDCRGLSNWLAAGRTCGARQARLVIPMSGCWMEDGGDGRVTAAGGELCWCVLWHELCCGAGACAWHS